MTHERLRSMRAESTGSVAESSIRGVLTEVSIELNASVREQGYFAAGKLDLLGEIKEDQSGHTIFVRGVREYPLHVRPRRPAEVSEIRRARAVAT